jgi:hypothetical protein
VFHIHSLLRKALQQAVIWQLRAMNPAGAVDAPRVQNAKCSLSMKSEPLS